MHTINMETSLQSTETTMSDQDIDEHPDPTLIWAPDVIENVSTPELNLFIKFAASACIPGGGCNVEEALDILYKCHGDIKEATKKLLMRSIKGAVIWTLDEVQMFEHLFDKRHKNFTTLSKNLKTKSVKDCVEFYYRRKGQQQLSPAQQQHYHYLQQHPSPALINQPVKQEQEQQVISQPHLQPHQQAQQQILIFQQQPKLEQLPANVILQAPQDLAQELRPDEEQFPCKVCGRIFLKIKSRSAHMKRHKNERLYNLT